MKKRKKGSPGYLDYKKRMEILRAVIYFLYAASAGRLYKAGVVWI